MSNNNPAPYDIVIVGAGMVGASLAIALRDSGLRIALVEAVPFQSQAQPSYDERNLALSLATQRILAALGVWHDLQGRVVPIRHIHVSDQKRFGMVRMSSDMLGLPALGYVTIARELGQALLTQLQMLEQVDLLCPAQVQQVEVGQENVQVHMQTNVGAEMISGRLLVLADGTGSKTRAMLGFEIKQKDYDQTAIIANITPEYPHNNTAYERFTSTGPLAILPATEQRCAMVFTVKSAEAERVLAMPDGDFLRLANQRFGRRLGRFQAIGQRRSYPIRLLEAKEPVRERVVLLGNSAHTMHPNAAQGFNLGLRDVAGLAEVLLQATAQRMEIGATSTLQGYMDLRGHDQQRVIRFTDGLAGSFYNNSSASVLLRNLAMLMTDMVPSIKRQLMLQAMGIRGLQPAMVRGQTT